MKFFASWKEFMEYSFIENETISHVVLSWNFNALFPDYKFPQTHKLTVKISNKVSANELLQMMLSGELDEVNDLDTNMYPIYAKVSFINRSLGDELVDAVGYWVEGLEENDLQKNKIALIMKKHKKIISNLIEHITFIFLTTNILFLFLNFLDSLNISIVGQINLFQLKRIFISAIIVLITLYMAKSISFFFGKSLYQSLGKYGQSYVFDITKGDFKKAKKLKKESKNNLINIAIKSLGTLIGNIIITYIVQKIIS